jgi:catechol 2,3-dioxygenase-like lactoylglutathione lyase family enzyme
MVLQLTGGGPEVGLVVRDPQRMLRFYRDFLGLPLDQELEFPGFHLWWLRCGGGFVKLVHLQQVPDEANPPSVWEATGLRYFTMRVENVEEVAAAVASAGGRLAYSRRTEALTQAMLQDPEGNHVELVRWH